MKTLMFQLADGSTQEFHIGLGENSAGRETPTQSM